MFNRKANRVLLVCGYGLMVIVCCAILLSMDSNAYIRYANVTKGIAYSNRQASLNGIDGLLIDKNDIIYCSPSGSGCLIAFDVNGKCLYSIYLPYNAGRKNEIVLVDGDKIAVEFGLSHDICIYQNGVRLKTLRYDSFWGYSPMQKRLREASGTELKITPSNTIVQDRDGFTYSYTTLYPSIKKAGINGTVETIVDEPFYYWLFSVPFPIMLFGLVGMVLIGLAKLPRGVKEYFSKP